MVTGRSSSEQASWARGSATDFLKLRLKARRVLKHLEKSAMSVPQIGTAGQVDPSI